MGHCEQPSGFRNGHNIRQTLCPWRFDQLKHWPGLIQNVGIEEFKTVQIKLNATPGVRFQQVAEIIGQLGFGQIVNLIVEISADAPHGTGIGVYRFGLESFEFKVFKMRLIVSLEIGFG
jgi:hypothetical protein